MLINFAKLSKKYPLALFLSSALLLGSCSPMKKMMSGKEQAASKTNQSTAIDRKIKTDSIVTMLATDTRHDKIGTETTTEQVSNEEVVTIMREYDTDKLTDTSTGTPPLKREISQTRRKTDAGRQARTTGQATDQHRKIAGQVNKQQTDKTNLQQQNQQQDDTSARVNTGEKRGLNTMQQLLCTLGGLFILGALVWLGWKFKRHL